MKTLFFFQSLKDYNVVTKKPVMGSQVLTTPPQSPTTHEVASLDTATHRQLQLLFNAISAADLPLVSKMM